MGSYESAQIAYLRGFYILDTQGRIRDRKKVGLNIEDGFILITDYNGPKTSKIHKKIKSLQVDRKIFPQSQQLYN